MEPPQKIAVQLKIPVQVNQGLRTRTYSRGLTVRDEAPRFMRPTASSQQKKTEKHKSSATTPRSPRSRSPRPASPRANSPRSGSPRSVATSAQPSHSSALKQVRPVSENPTNSQSKSQGDAPPLSRAATEQMSSKLLHLPATAAATMSSAGGTQAARAVAPGNLMDWRRVSVCEADFRRLGLRFVDEEPVTATDSPENRRRSDTFDKSNSSAKVTIDNEVVFDSYFSNLDSILYEYTVQHKATVNGKSNDEARQSDSLMSSAQELLRLLNADRARRRGSSVRAVDQTTPMGKHTAASQQHQQLASPTIGKLSLPPLSPGAMQGPGDNADDDFTVVPGNLELGDEDINNDTFDEPLHELAVRLVEVQCGLRCDLVDASSLPTVKDAVSTGLKFLEQLDAVATSLNSLKGAVFQECLGRGEGLPRNFPSMATYPSGVVPLEDALGSNDTIDTFVRQAIDLCGLVRIKLADDNDLKTGATVLFDSQDFFQQLERAANSKGLSEWDMCQELAGLLC